MMTFQNDAMLDEVITQPYVGLRAFNRAESAIFFGREEHTDALLDALARQQFLAVVGLSGSGKSSLVKCGLIPALESGYLSGAGTHWCIADFRPSNDPFKNFADSLCAAWQTIDHTSPAPSPDELTQLLRNGGAFSLHEYLAAHPLPKSGKLLLICDQFEELFRYHAQHDNAQAAAFVALLLASSRAHTLADGQTSNGIYLVLTMRSDFLGECAQFVGLAEAINQGLYLTPRLNREQLRLAIEEPALIAGSEADPALVVQLLEDVSNNPDQLPLLQHVLMRLWDEGQDLSLQHYQALGGLSAALDRHAELALAELNPQQQKIAETLFRALTERNREGKDTRRPVNAQAVRDMLKAVYPALDEGQFWDVLVQVIDTFRQSGRNFLMPPPDVAITPDTTLDISHESLIRQWVRLQNWVADEADQAAMYQRLGDAAERHQAGKGEWWHGSDLALALDWQRTAQPTPAWASRYGEPAHFFLAMQFLQDSQIESQRLAAEKEARRKAELKRVRTQRQWLGAGLLVTTLLMGWAFHERDKAQKAEAASAAMQVELVKFTLSSLIAKQQNITDYMQELVKKGQQTLLLDLTKAELGKISDYRLAKEAKQDWQSKLPTLSLADQIQLIRLVFAAKYDEESFTALARELRTPPPVVSARIPDMVSIPAGSFIMGCQDGRDKDCQNDEKPAHKVQIAAFELGKYEVTQGQWQAVMGSPPPELNFKTCGDTCPVERVSWDDIQVFIQKLNAQTGKTYRLPSEAEWEYACRAGKDDSYCGGDHAYSVAWYNDNSEGTTHPVGRKQTNAFGLYDMSGNVWEWVQDTYHETYTNAPTNGSAWEGTRSDARVLRGGSWVNYPQSVRAAYRIISAATFRINYAGFRLARTLP